MDYMQIACIIGSSIAAFLVTVVASVHFGVFIGMVIGLTTVASSLVYDCYGPPKSVTIFDWGDGRVY